ncbi:peptidase domain-containing ABC transporter [Olivibacter domesticus]|uniref:ATP-binding cassette, subfamily B n=1 Tax=Olivibacter domesticus TaxID=407022 RepID=A0A1H7M6Z3_OLID1|nr:peptidase domain-containing ABC transporter [Olivibacter domesticus]SEL06515.1 ATP-binding cassette, subfamily B [Olivibacter domesticus]
MGKKVKQRDITDCGAACIASVAAHYKLAISVANIRQLASTDKKGTNILGLLEAAEKLGFEAKGVRGSFESLFKIPKPAIAHIVVEGVLQHYVVIYKVSKRFVEVMDPLDGMTHKKSHEDFKKIWTGALVLLIPSEAFQKGKKTASVRSRFWNLMKPQTSTLIQVLFGAIIYTILGLSTAVFVQKIVDFVLVDGNINLLNLMSIMMIVILGFQLFIGATKTVFTLKMGQIIDSQLILGYYKHLLTLPQKFFDTMRVGEVISRINDAVKIRVFLNDVSVNFLVNIFIVTFSFLMMFTYYWKLGLLMLTVIPLYLLVYFIANKLNRKVQRTLMEDSAELESQLVESLNAVRTIKQFGAESYANEKTETRFVKLLKTGYQSNLNTLFASTSSEFISRLITIALLWVGATYVLKNQITPGELLSFYTLISYFTTPVTALINMNKTVQDAAIATDRLFEILDLECEEDNSDIELTKDKIGDIQFKNISFRYGSRANVFDDLSLNIQKAKFTAIVGESGSGKSTLISILQHIYPVQGGTITIGKYDLKHIKNASLRQIVSVVPQHIDLFSGNVASNIALGDYTPDMQRIIDITTQLGIIDFIESLPQGFYTNIGENGLSLSGGQRQRIAIARALYRNPEILILDEATSSLDSTSEKFVLNTIDHLKRDNKTIIVIAHRLSTLYNADKIIVLDKGKVIEQGTHQELLLTDNSMYSNLWKLQSQQLILKN